MVRNFKQANTYLYGMGWIRRTKMRKEIDMTQYGLTEAVEKSAERFADLTVSRVLSQESLP